jgi:outer membrane protein assembly factor BamB
LPALPALLVVLPMIAMSILIAVASLLRPSTMGRAARLAWRQRWALLVFGGVIFGVVWIAARTGSVSGKSDDQQLTIRGADWPMDRGGLRRLGYVSNSSVPLEPGRVWVYRPRAGSEAFYSSPAVVGNRLYVVGSQNDEGRIYCLDAITGDVIWSVKPPGYRATFSSPVIAGTWLVCGEGMHHARQARVVCIDLRDEHEGEIAWTFTTRGHVECTPVIDNGQVFFGAGDDGVYCLDLNASENGSPRVIWHAPGSQFPDAETSIAVVDNYVYVGLGLNGNALSVLDRDTGRELKRIPFPYPIFSPPAIHNGKLYVGMGVGDYVTPNENPIGQVACVDLETLNVDWTFNTSATVLGAVVCDEMGIVFGCSDGNVVRVDGAGHEMARYNTHAPILASPSAAQDMVMVVNDDGMLYALTADNLDVVWEERLGRQGKYFSAPTIAHGHVYVGTELNGLLCVGQPARTRSLGNWPGELGGAGVAGCRDRSKIPVAPMIRWQFPGDEKSNVIVTSPVAPAGDGVLVPVAAGDLAGLVYVTDRESGKPQAQWQLPLEDGIWSSPTVAREMTFFVSGKRGDAACRLHGVSIGDPSEHWSKPLRRGAAGVLLADEHSIIVQCERSSLCALDHRGDELWQKSIGRVEQLVSANAAVIAAAIDEPPALVLLDRPTGQQLWRETLDGRPTTAPVIFGDKIIIGTAGGLELHRIDDGRLITRNERSMQGVRGPFFVDPSACVFLTAENILIAAQTSDLSTTALTDLSEMSPQNFLLTKIGGVVENEGHLRRLHRVSEKFVSLHWLDTTELGKITSPMVLHNSRVYLGIDGRGLVCIAEGSPE